jgi:hypothetical protein
MEQAGVEPEVDRGAIDGAPAAATDSLIELRARARPVRPQKPGVGALDPRFVSNLGLLALLLAGGNLWLWGCTDWTASGYVLLGGVAVAYRLLKPQQREGLRKAALGLLAQPRGTGAVLTAFGVAALAGSFLGTIEIVPVKTSGSRVVSIGSRAPYPIVDGRLRFVVPTTLWSSAVVRVKVDGYPDRMVTVRPFLPTPLTVPTSFVRPVVLLRPDRRLLVDIAHNPMMLHVRIGTEAGAPIDRRLYDFHGQPVWIACDPDVELPADERARLERDFEHLPELQPVALGGDRFELAPGDDVDVQVLFVEGARVENNSVYLHKHFQVKPAYVGVPPQIEMLYGEDVRYYDVGS